MAQNSIDFSILSPFLSDHMIQITVYAIWPVLPMHRSMSRCYGRGEQRCLHKTQEKKCTSYGHCLESGLKLCKLPTFFPATFQLYIFFYQTLGFIWILCKCILSQEDFDQAWYIFIATIYTITKSVSVDHIRSLLNEIHFLKSFITCTSRDLKKIQTRVKKWDLISHSHEDLVRRNTQV